MRTARDGGGVETLLPEGISHLGDCPYPLFEAIGLALQFLSWMENLDGDEMPPRSIWLVGDELQEHFADVKRRRKEKYDTKGPGPIEDAVQNQAATELKTGLKAGS